MEGVCSLRLPQRSLVDGLVGFECRHLAASRWTPREGPNSCPNVVVVVAVVVVAVGVVAAVVVGSLKLVAFVECINTFCFVFVIKYFFRRFMKLRYFIFNSNTFFIFFQF